MLFHATQPEESRLMSLPLAGGHGRAGERRMSRKWTGYAAAAAGLLVSALGIVMLAGWATRALVRLITSSTAMPRNTAPGLTTGIDEILGKSYFGFAPDRMSPITTLCFILAGCAIFSLPMNAGRRFRSWAPGIFASVPAAIGSVNTNEGATFYFTLDPGSQQQLAFEHRNAAVG